MMDSVDRCPAAFISWHLIKHRDRFDNALAQVTEANSADNLLISSNSGAHCVAARRKVTAPSACTAAVSKDAWGEKESHRWVGLALNYAACHWEGKCK